VSKRILIVVPNRTTFVTAWCFELAFEYASAGDSVFLLDLAHYETRYRENSIYWVADRVQESNDIRDIVKPILKNQENVTLLNPRSIVSKRFNKDLTESENSVFEFVIRSMYARKFGSRQIAIDDLSPSLIRRELNSYSIVLNSLRNHLVEVDYDAIVTVNGRGLFDSCAVTVAKENKLKYLLVEKTSDNWDYYSVQEISTHSALEVQGKVDSFFERYLKEHSLQEAQLRASEYYAKPAREQKYWLDLQTGETDISANLSKSVIFFPSSDHEFSTHSDPADLTAPYKNQFEAFQDLAAECKKLKLQVIVRVHPHPPGSVLQIQEDKIWRAVCEGASAQFIGSSDPMNSLRLAKAAHLNIVYTSTFGAEIAFHELPLLVLGDTTYAHLLPGTYIRRIGKIEKALQSPVIPYRNQITPWLIYRLYGEIELKHFKIIEFDHVLFEGKRLNTPRRRILSCIQFLASLKVKKSIFVKSNSR
jgi:hypothetical protein